MTVRLKSTLALGAAIVVMAGLGQGAAAKEQNAGDDMCIPAHDMHQMTVIGHKAIVVEMRGANRGYKRIDIANNCTGLNNVDPIVFDTAINKLCRQDTLRIAVPAGQTCLIDKIVTIEDAEAKNLIKTKGRK